jgi:hypothetical protein
MPFITLGASDGIVPLPLPKGVLNKPIALTARYTDELFTLITPRDSIKMSWLPANITNKSPMPLTSWKITSQVKTRISEGMRFIN